MSDVRIERMVERVLLCMSTLDPEQEQGNLPHASSYRSQMSCHTHKALHM